MNRHQQPTGKPAPVVKRPQSGTALQGAAAQSRRRNEIASQWKALVIGVFVIGGVFVYLELTRPAPQKTGRVAPAATTQQAPQTAKPAVSEALEDSSAAPVAQAETVVANPPLVGV